MSAAECIPSRPKVSGRVARINDNVTVKERDDLIGGDPHDVVSHRSFCRLRSVAESGMI